jgi:dipeptidase D
VTKAINAEADAIREELAASDPGVVVTATAAATLAERVFDVASARRVLAALVAIPHGVEAMSLDVPGLVETSSNLAAVRTEGDTVSVLISVRSSIRSALLALRDRAHAVAALAGGSVEDSDPYPGWKPNLKSEVLRVARTVHERELSRAPELKAVHAGLECGVIGEKLPGIDMISIGPWIESPHSPGERVNVPSVVVFWKFLKALVAELA